MLGASGDANEPMTVAERVVGKAEFFGTEKQGDGAGGETLADEGSGGFEAADDMVGFARTHGGGAEDQGTIGDGVGNGGEFLGIGEQIGGANGGAGFAKGQLVRIDDAQVLETEIGHNACGGSEIEGITSGDQDDAKLIEMGRSGHAEILYQIGSQARGDARLGGQMLGRGSAADTVIEKKKEDGEESSDGIEQRVVGGSGAAGDEGLMNFVQRGVEGGDRKGCEGPAPVPSGTRSANGAIEQNTKDEIFGEVGGFADEEMDAIDLIGGDGGDEGAQEGSEDETGMRGGESVGRQKEDKDRPEQCGPPGSQPGRRFGEGSTFTEFGQLGRGTGVAPRLFWQVQGLRATG